MTAPVPAPAHVVGETAFWMGCRSCNLAGGPYRTRAEAVLLAGLHDQVHHGSSPTATVTHAGGCESCRRAPATCVWSQPGAGAPFDLCARCHPDGSGGEG